MTAPTDILDFWFADEMRKCWFRSTPALDKIIRQRFEDTWLLPAGGGLDHWAQSADGALALVIVLDQLPLNMFRGQARSFSTETRAIAICKQAVRARLGERLDGDHLAFLYMPLMHSEDIADQDLAVRLFETAGLESNLRFARHHRELIRRFGRFPHRNALLGRASTPAERAYLDSKEAFTG